jgi:lipopolysaccharide biosynthesis regulator YciM
MNISATLIGQIIVILIPVFAAISYYLGKRNKQIK